MIYFAGIGIVETEVLNIPDTGGKKMKIMLKLPDGGFDEREIEEGAYIEDVYKSVKDSLAYPCIAAKVDNEYQDLRTRLWSECKVELLDMRSKGACRVYQASISMVFLTAAKKVLGDVLCQISNTLNKGLFIELKMKGGATDEIADKIKVEMESLIKRDLPFKKEILTREEGLERIKEIGDKAKMRLLEGWPKLKITQFYTLDGYSEFFYFIMAPSTGYVSKFTLERYRKGLLLRFPDKYAPDGIPEYLDEPNMYKTFAEQSEWDELLGVNYVCDLNDKIVDDDYKDLIMLSEALHDKKITEIANTITEQKKRLVLIAGPSSSGKTTFAKRLCVHLRVNGNKALYMGTDDYFLDREEMKPDANGEYDFEGLDAVDTELFNRNMRDLIDGKEVDIPEFDFVEGKKVFGKRLTKIDKNTVIVIEGIHALNEVLTSEISKDDKFKVYISPLTQLNIDAHNRVPTTDERLLRRIVRDDRTRGRDAARTIADWPKVRRGEDQNIFRYNDEADVMFNSYHIYEIAVLKRFAAPLMEKITKDQPEYAEAQRILKLLRYFREIEDTSAIGCDSILREFIGGSVFVS